MTETNINLLAELFSLMGNVAMFAAFCLGYALGKVIKK